MHKHDILMLEFLGSSNGPFFGGLLSQLAAGFFLFKARRNTEKEKAAAEKTMAKEFSCWGVGKLV